MARYAVVTNLEGYMPDNMPEFCENLATARLVALDIKRMFYQDNWSLPKSEQWHASGNIRKDWQYRIYRNRPNSLDYYITIHQISEDLYNQE